MAYPVPASLKLPITPYSTSDAYRFRQRLPRYKLLWMTHLGDDVLASPGTPVQAIGDGEVVYATVRPGSEQRRDWGGLVILGHTDKQTHEPFFSLYGHLSPLAVKVGEQVQAGQVVGSVAPGNTPENGWWATPHLHFAIYDGPWRGSVLPGYKRFTRWWKTRLSWWHDPVPYLESYSKGV